MTKVLVKRITKCAVFMFLIGCDTESNNYQIESPEIIRQIGSMESTRAKEFFGMIQGLAIDQHANVYVVDSALATIKRFNWNGEYQTEIGRGAGDGPGELLEPAEIAIDKNGFIYVGDRQRRYLSIFGSDGDFLQRLDTSLVAAPISVWDMDHIYCTRWGWGGWEKDRLIQFSTTSGLVKEAVGPTDHIKTITSIGMYPLWHSIDSNGRIYTISPYPYEVNVFDADLNLLSLWKGEGGLVTKPPFLPSEYPERTMVDLCAGIAIGPNGLVFVRIQSGDKPYGTILDVYNIDGTFVERIPTSSFGIERIGFYYAIGPNSTLVCTVNDPFPIVYWVDLTGTLSRQESY